MTETTPPADCDGCNSQCRRAGKHTLTWGLCEHAVRPEPTVSMSKIYRATDGYNSIGYDTYTVPELARLIEPALGDPLKAAAAARAIVHRNDTGLAAVTVSASAPADDDLVRVLPAPTNRAAILREAADALPEADLRLVPPMDRKRVANWLRRLADAASGPGRADGKTQQDETQAAFTVQVWPLTRVLTEARCGSQDWTWDEEWADLDSRHAESGYLAKLEQDIRANGITMPVLIGTDGRIWDGHHRLRIAVRAGIDYVPVEVPAAVSQPDGEA